MKIHNVRLGLATNSSSTHSLIFIPGSVHDQEVNGEYGWNFFTAASPEGKKDYVAAQLFGALRELFPNDIAAIVVKDWVGLREFNENSYVDHQSQYHFPRSWDGKSLDKDFFTAFKWFMMRDNLVVLGGNDNTESRHPLDDGSSFTLDLPRDSYGLEQVARRDGDYWTLFNRNTGAKIRMSFDPNAKTPTKASAPELVDIKITDFCPYNCAYCYQGSTTEGKHANKELLSRLAFALEDLRVFEVALGGGETTLHPNFAEIVQTFRSRGIVPNFTTKSLSWLTDPDMKSVLANMGSFAYTVESGSHVRKLVERLALVGLKPERVSVQYVMGSSPIWELDSILEAAAEESIRVTLLGYKTTGRGSFFKPNDYKGWLDVLSKKFEKHRWMHVGIDTALASEFENELLGKKVPAQLFTTKEGAFSMYVDATGEHLRVGPSSYCDSLRMRELKLRARDQLTKEIQTAFKAMAVV